MGKKIGETFEFEGKWLKVKEEDAKNACRNCYLVAKECSRYLSIIGECLDKKRSDNKNIVFEDITYKPDKNRQQEEQQQEQAEQPQELNLCEILKDCPEGTVFWSDNYGKVKFIKIDPRFEEPILTRRIDGYTASYTKEGWHSICFPANCLLWPSRDCRDWAKFTVPRLKKERFDPKTLKAFDRVIVYGKNEGWFCSIFSHIGEGEYPYNTASGNYAWCILYNDDTKHLVGTTDEAPDFYKYWED